MKKRIIGLFIVCTTITLLGSSMCTAADVKVMYAVGLLENGENAKLLTTEEFSLTVGDYDKFKNRIAQAPTLRAMVQNGWKIVHAEQAQAKFGDPYRGLNYYLIIFQGGR